MTAVKYISRDRNPINLTLVEVDSELPLWDIHSKHYYELLVKVGTQWHPCRHEITIVRTDLASIPRWLHFYANPADRFIVRGALLHDDLYKHKGLLSNGLRLNRSEVDRLFLQVCKSEKPPRQKRLERWQELAKENIAFGAVRLFGSSSWPD